MDITAFCNVNLPNSFRVARSSMAKFQVEFPASRLSAFEESLKFVVIGPNKQPVETDGRETKSGVYELSFKCDVSGDYLVGTGLGKDSKYVEVSVLDPLEVLALESKLEVVGDVKLQSMVPVAFSVEFPTRLAAKKAVVVLGPDGKEISVKKEVHVQGSVRGPNSLPMRISCSFTPVIPGKYVISATVESRHHAVGSPVSLELAADSGLKHVVSTQIETILSNGPFLSLAPITFDVSFPPELADVLNISVFDQSGKSVESCDGSEVRDGLWRCVTSPIPCAGLYTIEICAGEHKSSKSVQVVPCESVFCNLCKAEGAGLEDNMIAAFARAPFRLFFPVDMPEDLIRITATDESGQAVEVDGEAIPGQAGCWICFYRPVEPGVHTISISCGDFLLPGFPKKVRVKDAATTFLDEIVCDLRKDVTTWDLECAFKVSFPSSIPADAIKAFVTYPSGTKVRCVRSEESPEDWSFACGMPGQYVINVLLNDTEIGPFVRTVIDPSVQAALECSVSGDGILSGMNTCGYATDFLLSFPCPEEHISISCVGPDGKPTLIDGSEVEGNTNCWKVEYLPQIEGEYVISIMIGETHIPNSPFKVMVRPSIGGRGKLLVFFSSASGKKQAQRDLNRLEQLFLAKGVLEVADFFAVDLMERDAREELFRISGLRTLPQIFINDAYIGDVETLQMLEDEHSFSILLEKMEEDSKKKSALEEMVLISGATGVKLGQAKAAIEGDKCLIM